MPEPTYEDVYEPPILDSTGQAIANAIQGLNPTVPSFISDAFSVERNYSKGDICIYDNKVYEFTSAKSAGAWDSTKVTQTTIGAVCTSLSNSLTQKTEWHYIGGYSSFPYTIPAQYNEVYIDVFFPRGNATAFHFVKSSQILHIDSGYMVNTSAYANMSIKKETNNIIKLNTLHIDGVESDLSTCTYYLYAR